MTTTQTIISVGQRPNGLWQITINGKLPGDARAFPTRDAAVEWSRKFTMNWQGAVHCFDEAR